MAGSPPNRKQRKPVEVACSQCGATVLRHPCRFDEFKRFYCSRSCYHADRAGKPLPEYHRASIASALTGERGPNWKGGTSRQYKRGYKSEQFKRWRTAVFERDAYTCQHCGQHGGYLTAHHIKGFAAFPDLRYDVSNGLTLCEECHKQTDNYKGRARRRKSGG